MNRQQLEQRLQTTVDQLDSLMAFLVTLAETQGIDPMRMQYPDGQPAMAPLVVAQGQALAALAQLQAAPGVHHMTVAGEPVDPTRVAQELRRVLGDRA